MKFDFTEDGGFSRKEIEQRRAYQQRLILDDQASIPTQESSRSAGNARRLNLLVLGSGSKGNASIVSDSMSGAGILIDAGICKRDVFEFSEQGGFDLHGLKAIMISHSHSDHVKNLGVVTRGLKKAGIEVPIYTHELTLKYSRELQQASETNEIRFFKAFDELVVDDLSVKVLPTSHDSEVSFGFRIEAGKDALGFVTDTGVVLPETLEALKGVRILALESNHDLKMLENGPYPLVLQERVSSDHGHLSNVQAAQTLEYLLGDNLETVVAMHISENNNTYRIPVETLRQVVSDAHANIQVTCAYQKRPVFITI